MGIDEELLETARRAGERAVDAQCEADVAKAEYHRAIRRLQLAGATMREIASALNLSHQRVQQIVDANGGGRRWRRHRTGDPALLLCSFCGSDQQHVKKLVAGPGVYICDRCIGAARAVASGAPRRKAQTRLVAAPPEAMTRCAFCGKARVKVESLVGTGEPQRPLDTGKSGVAAICNECLDLCTEIIEHESHA